MATNRTITVPNGPDALVRSARRAERAERVALMAQGHKPARAATHASARDKARRRRPKHRGNGYAE